MIVEQYGITIEGLDIDVPVTITIEHETTRVYTVLIPPISEPTRLLLNDIRNAIVPSIATMQTEQGLREARELRQQLLSVIEKEVAARIGSVPEGTRKFLVLSLLNDMTGLGDLEYLLADPNLEEIVVPAAMENVMVYHRKHGWLHSNITIRTEDQVLNYASIIARRVSREISVLKPILDARLTTGDRANAVLYPIANRGNTMTIRKFARDPWTCVDFIKNGTCTAHIFALLWVAIQYEMNVLFSGGTATGKTSMLNVCLPFVPPNQRIISIEDTRELQLPDFLFWEPLVTRQPNPEGKGEVDMLDLLITSLRMRPDRIVMGEVRRGDHATVLFEAMHTGHSVYATLHADTIQETVHRLVNPPISIPANLLDAVHLCVVMFRDRRKSLRRVYQIGEFVGSKEGGEHLIRPNVLYRYSATEDAIVPHAQSVVVMDKLCQHLGCAVKDIETEIAQRESILNWLVRHEVRGITAFARVMELFYGNPTKVIEAARKDVPPGELLK